MTTTEIKRIVLTISGKEIELTVNQARDLKRALSDIFQDAVQPPVTVPIPYPVPVPRWPLPIWERPYITWGSVSGEIKERVAYLTSGSARAD